MGTDAYIWLPIYHAMGNTENDVHRRRSGSDLRPYSGPNDHFAYAGEYLPRIYFRNSQHIGSYNWVAYQSINLDAFSTELIEDLRYNPAFDIRLPGSSCFLPWEFPRPPELSHVVGVCSAMFHSQTRVSVVGSNQARILWNPLCFGAV
jgi:hypothetical protein